MVVAKNEKIPESTIKIAFRNKYLEIYRLRLQQKYGHSHN